MPVPQNLLHRRPVGLDPAAVVAAVAVGRNADLRELQLRPICDLLEIKRQALLPFPDACVASLPTFTIGSLRRWALRDGRLRTNIGNVSTLDDAVAAFNPTKRINGKTIIRVHPWATRAHRCTRPVDAVQVGWLRQLAAPRATWETTHGPCHSMSNGLSNVATFQGDK